MKINEHFNEMVLGVKNNYEMNELLKRNSRIDNNDANWRWLQLVGNKPHHHHNWSMYHINAYENRIKIITNAVMFISTYDARPYIKLNVIQ